jgi:hypothetical protein
MELCEREGSHRGNDDAARALRDQPQPASESAACHPSALSTAAHCSTATTHVTAAHSTTGANGRAHLVSDDGLEASAAAQVYEQWRAVAGHHVRTHGQLEAHGARERACHARTYALCVEHVLAVGGCEL